MVIGTDYIGSCKSNYHTITMTPLYLDRMLSNYFILRKKTISSICLNEIPDIPPFFTGTLIVMGVLIFFKKKTGLSPSQAIATKNGNAGWALTTSSISGVLAIVCAVLVGCRLIMKDSDIDDETDYSQWYNEQTREEKKSPEQNKKPEFYKF